MPIFDENSDAIGCLLYLERNLSDFDCLEVVRMVCFDLSGGGFFRADDEDNLYEEDVVGSYYSIQGHLIEGHVADIVDVATVEQAELVAKWVSRQIEETNMKPCPIDWYGREPS
jgi:uncharacterized membrane protein (UPF0136 family)